MQKRKRHPLYGVTSFVSGPINKGEFPVTAAKRILQEETGLEADLKLLGFVRKVFFDESKNIIGDTLYHICYGENIAGELLDETVHGENFWVDIDQAIELELNKASKIAKEFEVLQQIKSGNSLKVTPFFYDEESQTSSLL